MKKYYETPSAEKIAFRYRDQVVAASGAADGQEGIENTAVSASCVVEYLFGLIGFCNILP